MIGLSPTSGRSTPSISNIFVFCTYSCLIIIAIEKPRGESGLVCNPRDSAYLLSEQKKIQSVKTLLGESGSAQARPEPPPPEVREAGRRRGRGRRRRGGRDSQNGHICGTFLSEELIFSSFKGYGSQISERLFDFFRIVFTSLSFQCLFFHRR